MNSKQPIPEGIFYSIPADNFYTIANPMTGQGIEFYARWKPRWKEFPYTRKDVVLHSRDILPPPYKPQSGDSITLVRGLGHQTPQEEAMREDALAQAFVNAETAAANTYMRDEWHHYDINRLTEEEALTIIRSAWLERARRAQDEVERLKGRIFALEEELKITDKLLEERTRLLHTVPACEAHGDECMPHAIQWVQMMRGMPPPTALTGEHGDAPSSNSEWEPLVIAHMKDLPPQFRAPGASLSTPLFMLRGPATSMPRRLIAKPRDCGECDVSFECHNGKSPCIREAGAPQFVVPHDLISHEEAWRRAILLARDSTLPGSDYAYWSIELSVFNVMHKQLEDAVVIETAKCTICTNNMDDPGLHYPGCVVRDGHCKKSGWQCDGNGNLHREVKGAKP
jgi:hypothetical protein